MTQTRELGGRRWWRAAARGGVLVAAALGLAAAPEPVRRARYLMGTRCTATAFPDDAGTAASLDAALDTIAQVEAVLSTWRDDSELSRLNRTAAAGSVLTAPLLLDFLQEALRLADATQGAFDPTVGPLVDVWDLRGVGRIPAEVELGRARRNVGYRRVRIDPDAGTVRYDGEGLWVDAGGIGKGYALDLAARQLRQRGVTAALLDFGGQLLAIGSPPGESGWSVAVADPRDRDRMVLRLSLRDVSVATSSQSVRGHQAGGRWIGHILDPRTGRPVERLGSVTVVAKRGTDADGLATALFVMGPERGVQWAAQRPHLAVGYLEPSGSDGLRLRGIGGFRALVTGRGAAVEWATGLAAAGQGAGR